MMTISSPTMEEDTGDRYQSDFIARAPAGSATVDSESVSDDAEDVVPISDPLHDTPRQSRLQFDWIFSASSRVAGVRTLFKKLESSDRAAFPPFDDVKSDRCTSILRGAARPHSLHESSGACGGECARRPSEFGGGG